MTAARLGIQPKRGRPRVPEAVEARVCELLRAGRIVPQVAEEVVDIDVSTIRLIAKRNGIDYVRAPYRGRQAGWR